ncbi:MAG TPA: hypothetical protein VE173_10180, partial [Longimicrobiales bacterium]|nr:hypothetical protein [Longimicrobiales bacterium]
LVSNPGADTVYYRIKIAGAAVAAGPIAPGANVTPIFPGIIGGPVEVEAWRDAAHTTEAKVMASQRVLLSGDTAFNEVPGIPAEGLGSVYHWTWYDFASEGARNWVLVANPPGAAGPVYYQILIGGAVVMNGGPVGAGDTDYPVFPGTIGGPVEARCFSDQAHTAAADCIATQRSLWGPSFEEAPGLPHESLTPAPDNAYHWTWYDMQSTGSRNWVLIANLGAAPVNATVRVAGVVRFSGSIPPGQSAIPAFPGLIGGPVEVTATGPVMASQRVLWNGYFNEVLGAVLE